ncbi:hypothetical protein F383_23512 [Gossypium arboreum]|nr:hypothetical protein F383_23512 [Gossypium arboreum]
MLQQHLI